MGLNKTADGRYIVGQGVENGNNYHGFNGKRDIVIQLTADGATADGLNALEYLKAYAMNAKTENKPIFPDGARVWISTNGYSKAVEADDVVIDGSNITIGGIAWNGSAWDFSNAGQSGGGGTGGGVLVVHNVNGTLDKTWQEIANAVASTGAVIVAENEGTVVKADVIMGAYRADIAAGYTVDTIESEYDTASASGYPTLRDSEGDTPVA